MTGHISNAGPHDKVYWYTRLRSGKPVIARLGERCVDHEVEFRVVERNAKRPDRTLMLKIGDYSRVELLADHHDRRSIPCD